MADTYTVERSTTIQASGEQVYPHIVDFKRWASWSPWEARDPSMEKTFSGSEFGVGAEYAWSGNRKVGSGRMKITDTSEPSDVRIALEFLKPFKSTNRTRFLLQPEAEGTKVTWSMTSRQTLMTRVMGIFKSMDSMIGPDFEQGLAGLKSLVEAER